ncbi:MAG TPA: hypothetical protein VMN79_01110 [Casimicrobiaceae bacterium]|nr:hypothetical protein [Casimicrobiaceae bacterium]
MTRKPHPRRAALTALAALAVVSLGCGKSETSHRTAARSTGGATGKSQALPDDFPKDVPILEGATLKLALSQGGRTIVHFDTTASVAEAAKFYEAALKAQGWSVQSSSSGGDMFVVSATKGSTRCGVTVSREGRRTLVRLAVSRTGS